MIAQDGKPGNLLLPWDQISGASRNPASLNLPDAIDHHDQVTFAVHPDGVTIVDPAAALRAAAPPAQ